MRKAELRLIPLVVVIVTIGITAYSVSRTRNAEHQASALRHRLTESQLKLHSVSTASELAEADRKAEKFAELIARAKEMRLDANESESWGTPEGKAYAQTMRKLANEMEALAKKSYGH